MASYKKVTETIEGKTFSLETGKLAKQANGSIFAQLGETQVLATVVSAKDPVADAAASNQLIVLLSYIS